MSARWEEKMKMIGLRLPGVRRTGADAIPGEDGIRYWEEDNPHALYEAVSDACWLYRYRDLEYNLRRFGWRRARRAVLAEGPLSNRWLDRGRGEVRLTRRGLEVRFESAVQTISWRELKEMIEARRS